MLLGVIPEDMDCLRAAGLDQGQVIEGHRTPTSSMVLERTDVAQTSGSHRAHFPIFPVLLLWILNSPVGVAIELVAELIDTFKPGRVPGQVEQVVLQTRLGSSLVLLGVNWRQAEDFQSGRGTG